MAAKGSQRVHNSCISVSVFNAGVNTVTITD
jgi:hypothetical protein